MAGQMLILLHVVLQGANPRFIATQNGHDKQVLLECEYDSNFNWKCH